MKKYWVYIHITPDGMVYVGRSGMKYTSQRWRPYTYKSSSLQPHIEKWGWENIKHEVVKDGLTKEESYELEDELIKMYKEKGVCINNRDSGGLKCDGKRKEYYDKHKDKRRDYYERHKDESLEQKREWYKNNRERYNEYMREYRKKKKEVV